MLGPNTPPLLATTSCDAALENMIPAAMYALLGLALFGVFVLLFAGTIVVALVYLAVS